MKVAQVPRPASDDDPSQLKLTLCRLRSNSYPIPGFGPVRATLWQLPANPTDPAHPHPTYAISLRGLGTRSLCPLGADRARAEEIFALIVRNTVTPVALREVLEELE